MKNKIIFNELPPDPPPRRSQRLATRSMKKQQQAKTPKQKQKSKHEQKQKNTTQNQSQQHIVELKKRPIIQAQSRPAQLTSNIFQSLYNSMIRVRATVQIIEWRKKRQNCYSVRISDGYFRIKVLATGDGGKQLAKEEIKQFYILDCVIDHQGHGVCMMSKISKWYQYGFSIGFTEAWKMSRVNCNPLGATKIEWEKWDKFKRHTKERDGVDEEKIAIKRKIINEIDENTVTFEHKIKQNQDSLVSKIESKRQLSTCKTDSISISASKSIIRDKIQYQKRVEIPVTRISEEQFFNQGQSNKQVKFVSASKKKQLQKRDIQRGEKSIRKNYLKTPYAQQQKQNEKKVISQQQHSAMLAKSQVKQKKLLLKQEASEESSEKQQHLHQKVQNITGFQRTQSIDHQKNPEQQDSWQDFFQDYLVYSQKNKQTAIKVETTDINKKDPLMKMQEKRKILEDLFQDSESESATNGQVKSLSNKKQCNKAKLSKMKESQTYSPPNIKSKNFNFADIFDDESQTMMQLDSRLPPVRVTSTRKSMAKNQQNRVNAFALEQSNEKVNLKWISKELSNVKKEQQKIVSSKKRTNQQFINKTPLPLKKFQTKDNSRNQVLMSIFSSEDDEKYLQETDLGNQINNCEPKTSILQEKIFTLRDLIEAEDFQSFCAFKGLSYQDSWFLKVKLLYIEQKEFLDKEQEKSNFLKPNSKIKQNYVKCLATSDDHLFLCTIMLSKTLKEKYLMKSNQTYLLQNPSIVENHSSQNQYMSFPENMYRSWIEVSESKTYQVKQVSSETLITFLFGKQSWMDSIQSIQSKQDNDLVNIMGLVRSIKQNNFANNKLNNQSKQDTRGDNSNSNQLSIKSNKQLTSKQQGSKTMTIIEIIDPFSGYVTEITDFGNNFNSVSKFMSIGIFRGRVNTYKSKKSIVSKSETIVVIGEFLQCNIGRELRAFYEENQLNIGLVVESIQIQLVGYQQAYSIYHVMSFQQSSKIYIRETKIFSLSKIAYIGCRICSKKLYQGKCPSCGVCKKQDVVERVMYAGVVGDESGSLRCFVEKAVVERVVSKKKQVREENMCVILQKEVNEVKQKNPWTYEESIESCLSLSNVQIWFIYQGPQKPITIDKINLVKQQNKIADLLAFINSGYE